ncbi:GNAT family N-acetyltransferase [Amycolatopsis lurida]
MLFPHTRSQRVALRPATAEDEHDFHHTVLQAGFGLSSGYGVGSPKTGRRKPHGAFAIAHRVNDELLGFGVLHSFEPGIHISLRIIMNPHRTKLGIGSEAIFLLVNYAFATLRIDKVITQTSEASFGPLGMDPQQNDENGILTGHVYFRGRLWDLHHFEIKRANWEEYVDSSLDNTLPRHLDWRAVPR